ncbi:hypothetical protein, partial [Microvirga sp. P5_D2]
MHRGRSITRRDGGDDGTGSTYAKHPLAAAGTTSACATPTFRAPSSTEAWVHLGAGAMGLDRSSSELNERPREIPSAKGEAAHVFVRIRRSGGPVCFSTLFLLPAATSGRRSADRQGSVPARVHG